MFKGGDMDNLQVLNDFLVQYEGMEYGEGGVNFYIALDKIEVRKDIKADIYSYLCDLKINKEELTALSNRELEIITDWEKDIRKLFIDWHINQEDIDKITEDMVKNDVNIYKLGDDLSYSSQGIITDIFRWIKVKDNWYSLEFYIVD